MAEHLDMWFLITVGTLSLVGSIANWKCAIKVWNTYNVNRALYLTVFLNSLLSAIGLACTFVAACLLELHEHANFSGHLAFCGLLYDSLVLCYWIGGVSVCLISSLR